MRVDRTERVEIGGTWRETHIIVQTVVLPQFDVFGDYNLPCNASYKRTIWYDDKLASIVKEEFEWLTGGIVGLWNTYALVNARPSPDQPRREVFRRTSRQVILSPAAVTDRIAGSRTPTL